MVKKQTTSLLPLTLVCLGLLSSCAGSYEASAEMKAFFDGISASTAYSFITSASVKTIYRSYDGDGNLSGTITGSYEFSKGEAYYLHKKYAYTGNEISDGIKYYEYLAKYDADSKSYYEQAKTNDGGASSPQVILEGTLATSIQELVYINTGSYNTGGLYYGDVFMINSNNFPNDAFVISEDKKTMSFVYKYAKAFTNSSSQSDYIQIDENTAINNLGMVLYSYEEISFSKSKELGHNEETVRYNEPIEKIAF